MNIEIADRLASLRKERGLSRYDLAELLNISTQEVAAWENKESLPGADMLDALADFYGIPVDKLIDPEAEIASYNSAGEESAGSGLESPDIGLKSADTGLESAAEAGKPGAPAEPEISARKKFWLKFPYALVVTVVYFIIGWAFNVWRPTLLLLLSVLFYRPIVSRLKI